MKYINMEGKQGLETVDEFETIEEAEKMLIEYRIADKYNKYYISSRCTDEWKNR